MFELSGDEKAAEKEFLEIIGDVQGSIKDEALKAFRDSFLKEYSALIKNLPGSYYKRPYPEIGVRIESILTIVARLVKGIERGERSIINNSKYLGNAFGKYLGAIESLFVYSKENPTIFEHEDMLDKILETNAVVVKSVKEAGHKIKKDFIKRRIMRLARKHRRNMIPTEKAFLAKLAAQWSIVT